jgi:hypothetical protein
VNCWLIYGLYYKIIIQFKKLEVSVEIVQIKGKAIPVQALRVPGG